MVLIIKEYIFDIKNNIPKKFLKNNIKNNKSSQKKSVILTEKEISTLSGLNIENNNYSNKNNKDKNNKNSNKKNNNNWESLSNVLEETNVIYASLASPYIFYSSQLFI